MTAFGAGNLHSLAVQNGAAYAWGYNNYGQLGNGGSTTGTAAIYTTPQAVVGLATGVTDISAGANHSIALANGIVYTWGLNSSGQLGNGTTVNSTIPIPVLGITSTIADVEAGTTSSYALGTDGSLWAWGADKYGELGNGVTTTTNYLTPQHIFAPTGYVFSGIDASVNASTVAVLLTAVPEPTMLGMAALLVLPMARRTRRTKRA